MAPVNLTLHHPNTKEGKEELTKRIADVHADAVIRRLNALNCPPQQKLALLDAVIEAVKERSPEQGN